MCTEINICWKSIKIYFKIEKLKIKQRNTSSAIQNSRPQTQPRAILTLIQAVLALRYNEVHFRGGVSEFEYWGDECITP